MVRALLGADVTTRGAQGGAWRSSAGTHEQLPSRCPSGASGSLTLLSDVLTDPSPSLRCRKHGETASSGGGRHHGAAQSLCTHRCPARRAARCRHRRNRMNAFLRADVQLAASRSCP